MKARIGIPEKCDTTRRPPTKSNPGKTNMRSRSQSDMSGLLFMYCPANSKSKSQWPSLTSCTVSGAVTTSRPHGKRRRPTTTNNSGFW